MKISTHCSICSLAELLQLLEGRSMPFAVHVPGSEMSARGLGGRIIRWVEAAGDSETGDGWRSKRGRMRRAEKKAASSNCVVKRILLRFGRYPRRGSVRGRDGGREFACTF